MVRPAGPAAAQQHADDAPDRDEPLGERGEIGHGLTLSPRVIRHRPPLCRGARLPWRMPDAPSDEVAARDHAEQDVLLHHRQQPQPALGDQVAGGADGGVDVDGDRRSWS